MAKLSHLDGNSREIPIRKQITRIQKVLFKIITGCVRQFDKKGEVIDVPAREIASCVVAFDKMEERKRIIAGRGAPKSVPAVNDPGKPTKRQPAPEPSESRPG